MPPDAVTAEAACTKERISVIADSRERGSELLELVQRSPTFDVQIRCLPRGDYLVENQVTVERKRYDDFAASIIDGRLFTQAATLSRLLRPLIVVEGPREPAPAIHPHALKGALLSLATAWRLPVVFSRDASDSAWILRTLGRQCQADTSPQLVRAGYRPKRLRSRQSFVLQGLPGVGPVLASRFLDTFCNLRGVFAAGEQELAEVHGCGPKRAAAIARIVGS